MKSASATDARNDLIKKASLISILGNAALASIKIATGFFSSSFAVLGDGIDSSTDVVISFITLAAARISSKPSDREHPYGHERAETIATVILSFIIFYAGIQLFITSVSDMISGAARAIPPMLAIYVTIGSIVGKLLLALSQFSVGKKANSSMLIANGTNMRNDVIISSGVLVGLFLTVALGLPILDRAFAAIIGLWIVKSAVGIFMEVNTELMDGTEKTNDVYRDIFAAIASVKEAGNPHRTRVRKLASRYVIDTDIEVDPKLSVCAAHEIAMKVEAAIKRDIPDVYDVLVHVEPRGNVEHDEQFGLDPEKLHPV